MRALVMTYLLCYGALEIVGVLLLLLLLLVAYCDNRCPLLLLLLPGLAHWLAGRRTVWLAGHWTPVLGHVIEKKNKKVRLYYRSGTGVRCSIDAGQTLSVHSPGGITFLHEIKVKVKEVYTVSGIPSHSYGVSLAIWDHIVLPATRHKWAHPPWRHDRHLESVTSYIENLTASIDAYFLQQQSCQISSRSVLKQ